MKCKIIFIDLSFNVFLKVCKIANSCCCSQRFPVIRIGEGKYRIGENGTIIFIRVCTIKTKIHEKIFLVCFFRF